MQIPAFEILTGDFIDLEGDCFADPDRESTRFQFELVEVIEVESEEVSCECGAHKRWVIAIGFEGFDIVGFPPYHLLNVKGGKE